MTIEMFTSYANLPADALAHASTPSAAVGIDQRGTFANVTPLAARCVR